MDKIRKSLAALSPDENGPLSRLVRRHRVIFFILFFGSITALSISLAFIIRFKLSWLVDVPIWPRWWKTMLVVAVPIRLMVFHSFGLHRVSWRFASLRDVPSLVMATLSGSVINAALLMWSHSGGFPRSVLVVETVLTLAFAFIGRYAYRILDQVSFLINPAPQTRVIIIGAGTAANLVLEAMNTPRLNDYKPVAIMDDDRLKNGLLMHGVSVISPIDKIQEVADHTQAEAIIIALPSISTSQLYRIAKLCRATGLPLKTTPDIWQVLQSSEAVARIQDFSMDDLLNRRVVRSDVPEIQNLVRGEIVLVTGAAGSIGSELCRQIAEQGCKMLVCMDKDENGLFRMEQELRRLKPQQDYVFYLADIKNRGRMDWLFDTYKPALVFHAAAYKHVPILQFHPVEAIRNNVGGTRRIARLAQKHGVKHFVMISTDKAVRPTSVMGATKQIAESVILDLGRQHQNGTCYSTIRFGNVLGSAGSVVELFLKQIKQGGPVTVTDPNIERFFMTISEAVHLVLYAASMGVGDDIFILDMGDPVNIDSLARQMIRLAGLTPDVDVQVEYTGLRPGEKLYEELWTESEEPLPTSNPSIRKAAGARKLPEDFDAQVESMLVAARANDLDESWTRLLALVPDFQGQTREEAERSPDPGSEGAK